MRKINTMISTIRSIYDENGNYLPAGNYYFEANNYNNGIFIGDITNNIGSFGTFRFTSPDLVKMMAVGQSRLINNTNLSYEIGMPNYPVPINNPCPNSYIPRITSRSNHNSILRFNRRPLHLRNSIRSRYVYEPRIGNNILINRNNETINSRIDSDESYNCTICMEEITNSDIKRLNCNHKFHQNCINEWLLENNTCPICRAPQTVRTNTLYNTDEDILNSTLSFLRRNRVYSTIDEIDRSYRENSVSYRHK